MSLVFFTHFSPWAYFVFASLQRVHLDIRQLFGVRVIYSVTGQTCVSNVPPDIHQVISRTKRVKKDV